MCNNNPNKIFGMIKIMHLYAIEVIKAIALKLFDAIVVVNKKEIRA